MSEIYEEIDANTKIVICSQSNVESICKDLTDKYEDIDIFSYASIDSNKTQLQEVNKYWIQANVLIYSPSIESGINFNIPHFNRITCQVFLICQVVKEDSCICLIG